MKRRSLSNVIGFDDSPFHRNHRGNIPIIGTVYAGLRFEGILKGVIRRDGANAAKTIIKLISLSRFSEHIQLIMLQGIALGGFNVVNVFEIHRLLNVPILIVSRKQPDFKAIQNALISKVPGGLRKWGIIEKLGPMEPVSDIFIQRVGLNLDESTKILEKFSIHGHIPEPLRTAHLISGGITTGHSRGRA